MKNSHTLLTAFAVYGLIEVQQSGPQAFIRKVNSQTNLVKRTETLYF